MRIYPSHLYLFLISIFIISACGQHFKSNKTAQYAPFQKHKDATIDTLVQGMTLDEKVAQLLFLRTTLKDSTHFDALKSIVQTNGIGGLMFSDVDEKYHGYWIDSLQQFSTIPFLNGVLPNTHISDFLSTTGYGLYSIAADSILEDIVSKRIAEYHRLGIQLNFEAHLSTITQLKRIIDIPAFNTEQMAILAKNNLLISAYQKQGIMVGLNSFSDYHISTPDRPIETDSILLPYYNLTTTGLSAILLDPKVFTLDTLQNFKTNSLRKYLTDSLEFGGLSISYAQNPQLLTQQFRAGSDAFIVELKDLSSTVNTLKDAIQKGIITEGMLDFSVKKILQAKSWTRQFDNPSDTLVPLLKETLPFEVRIFETSTVVAKDDNNILPLKNIHRKRFLLAHFDESILPLAPFKNHHTQPTVQAINFKDDIGELDLSLDLNKINRYDYVVISIVNPLQNAQQIRKKLNTISAFNRKKIIIVYTGHPKYLNLVADFPTVIYQPANTPLTQRLIPEVVLGGTIAEGKTPMSTAKKILFGQAKPIQNKMRLRQSLPEEVGIAAADLKKIDLIVREGIKGKAMPSCQVLVARNGNIIYDKAFGHHTYDKKTKVNRQNLYDLASITKVVSTTMAMMKLYQQGKYSLSDSLYQIFGKDTLSNIDYITVRELMIHQSGLQANMPILRYYHNKKQEQFYSASKLDHTQTQIAENLYLIDGWVDTLWKEMKALELGDKKYQYSDINANLMQWIVEKITSKRLDEYVTDYYYKPLRMTRTRYNPLEEFEKKEIVPTEYDNYWRRQLVHGYVHDESAALQGGIAGNAGLFSTAHDLAILSQMLLNGGNYAGRQYLQPETIRLFTAATHGNHRGLGFNKPTTEGATGCADAAPLSTFGHTGFTGNCFWIDPENELIYIFLSNRVYPKRNGRLSKMKIRERIHETVYNSFLK